MSANDTILDTPLPDSSRSPDALTYSTIGSRFLASLVDGLVVSVVALLPNYAAEVGTPLSYFSSVIYVAFLVYYGIYQVQASGTTPGKRLMKLKVVRLNGTSVGWREAIVRYLPFLILVVAHEVVRASVVLLIGDATIHEVLIYTTAHEYMGYMEIGWVGADILLLLITRERRALHDVIAGTVVISAHPKNLPSS